MNDTSNNINVTEIDINKYINLIKNNPCHIATVSKDGKPNLAVAADVYVLNKTQLLISHNEMINTPKNIITNKNVVITVFNDKWSGIRLTGEAQYFTDGEYMNLCNKYFKNHKNIPKGVIVVQVNQVESLS